MKSRPRSRKPECRRSRRAGDEIRNQNQAGVGNPCYNHYSMKALTLTEYKKFSFGDAPDPKLGAEDVLVRVKACGICGSDVHGMDGSTGRRRPPIIMGHEASGTIAQVGSQVVNWKPGDRVTFDSTVYCGECDYCRQGRINLCDNRRVLGVSCEEYRRHGAFAEFVAVPARILYRLPEGLPFEQAAFVEPLSIAVHAAHRSGLKRGETAMVVGAGMIGLLQIQVLHAFGASRIIAVDLADEKLQLAATLGATETVNAKDCPANYNLDHAFEAVGISSTVDLAMRSVRKGGSVTLVGNVSPKIEWSLQVAVTRELTIYGSCSSSGEYPECLDLMARGTVDVLPLISQIVPLVDGAAWFERLHSREPGLLKVILKP
jgi:L-iditol 2-dehydrogenase